MTPLLNQYVHPEVRAREARQAADRAEKTAIYEAGGLQKGALLALVTAILASLRDDERQSVLALLTLSNGAGEDPQTVAALTYAKSIIHHRAALDVSAAKSEGKRHD